MPLRLIPTRIVIMAAAVGVGLGALAGGAAAQSRRRVPAPAARRANPSPATPARTRVADIAWIAGHWFEDTNGRYSEEAWTGPAGGSMLGMWRTVEGGRPQTVELLTLSDDPDGLVLRLRHFDPQLVPQETAPLALRLAGVEGARATFEGQGATGPVRVVYHRTSATTLGVTLEAGTTKEEFNFQTKDTAGMPAAAPSAAP